MEEQQIQRFVHAILQDENLRNEFVTDPDAVIMREGFSPRLSGVIRKLVPHVGVDLSSSVSPMSNYWLPG